MWVASSNDCWICPEARSKSLLQDSSIFVIDHVEPTLTAERTHVLGGVADTIRSEMTTDSVLRTLRVGDREIPTRVYRDEQTLVLDQAWSQGDDRVSNLVRHTLEDGGETLIADEYMRGAGDEHHNVWTFRRL